MNIKINMMGIVMSYLDSNKKLGNIGLITACIILVLTGIPVAAEDQTTVVTSESDVPVLPSGDSSFTDTLESSEKESGVLTKSFAFPLQDFMPNPEPIVLRKANAQHALFFPVSERLDVTAAELRLKFTNSISLLQDRSQIRIKLNGITVAQLPLRPDQSQVDVAINLPSELIRAGFNNLTLWVAQHYTLECEDPAAPELWTEIDTYNSELKLTGELQPVDAMLSELEFVMGPAVGNPQQYRILMPEGYAEPHLGTGALIAEAVGLRHFYRSPLFNSATARRVTSPVYYTTDPANALPGLDQTDLSGSDNIIFGTRDELSPYLSQEVTSEIKDAYVGLFPLAADPRYFIMVVSGTNHEELKRAASSLSFLNFPYTDAKSTLISATDIPPRARYGRKTFIETDRLYTLEELGLKTTTVQGSGFHQLDLIFDLPPDFYAAQDAAVELSLDFSYGARLRNDSVLNVMLNDSFERVLPLSDPDGAVFKAYTIRIPLRSFLPGRNRIRFEPALIPSVGGECIAVNDQNLLFTLYGTSVIKLPFATKYAALPNLGLFSNTVFPYRRNGEPQPMAVSILSNDHYSIAAAWTLLAKFAQVADGPTLDTQVGFSVPQDDRELIVVSTYSRLDKKLMGNAPLSLDGSKDYPYPVTDQLPGKETEKGFIGSLTHLFGNEKVVTPGEPIKARINQNVAPNEHGLVTAFLSPYGEKRTVTLFAAETGEKLHSYMNALVQPSLWSRLDGDVALWSDSPRLITSQTVAEKFYVGDANVRDKMRFHVSGNPWWWIAGVFVLIFILAWLTRVLLNRRFIRRHGSDVRIED